MHVKKGNFTLEQYIWNSIPNSFSIEWGPWFFSASSRKTMSERRWRLSVERASPYWVHVCGSLKENFIECCSISTSSLK